MKEQAKTTAVDDARNPFGYERGFTIEQHRDELIERLGEAIKQLSEQRTTIERLEGGLRQAKKDAANVAKQYTEQVDRGISRQAEIAQLQAHVAQLEQDRLKLEGELRQEREAREAEHKKLEDCKTGRAFAKMDIETLRAQVAQLRSHLDGVQSCGECRVCRWHDYSPSEDQPINPKQEKGE